MSELVPWMVAEKNRLIDMRDALTLKITNLAEAIELLRAAEIASKPDASPYVTRAAAASTGKKPAPTKKGAAEPISLNDLIAKAAEWGITQDRDWAPSTLTPDELLAAVNKKAERVGHKLYALQSRSPHDG